MAPIRKSAEAVMFDIFKPRKTRAVETPPEPPAAEPSSHYNPDNMRQQIALLEAIYENICARRDDAEVLELYAGLACELVICVRDAVQIDLGTLAFPIEMPPLAASHPIMKTLPGLEGFIVNYFNMNVGDANTLEGDAKWRLVSSYIRMQCALIWKGYLVALNADPAHWLPDAVYAPCALRLLSTANATKVLAFVRDPARPDFIRNNVRDGDWPPPAFINLYLKHADLLADKLLGIRAFKQGDVDVMKQVAKQTWLRRRQELDRGPRASPKEITARSKRLQTIDGLRNAYDEMRRDDFCDVVVAAVKDGKLSPDAETMALFYREWVLSEADLQMISFIEWLDVDGRMRMQVLNAEWVGSRLGLPRESADRAMPFNKWLVSNRTL
jgi:hypothetical protein